MGFPRKFKHLLEIELGDVETPAFVLLTYNVCACEKDSCGWGGWMIECVAREHNDEKIWNDSFLDSNNEQICPRCGKITFRTGATVKFEPAKDQSYPWQQVSGVDYEVEPIQYEDD